MTQSEAFCRLPAMPIVVEPPTWPDNINEESLAVLGFELVNTMFSPLGITRLAVICGAPTWTAHGAGAVGGMAR